MAQTREVMRETAQGQEPILTQGEEELPAAAREMEGCVPLQATVSTGVFNRASAAATETV